MFLGYRGNCHTEKVVNLNEMIVDYTNFLFLGGMDVQMQGEILK